MNIVGILYMVVAKIAINVKKNPWNFDKSDTLDRMKSRINNKNHYQCSDKKQNRIKKNIVLVWF